MNKLVVAGFALVVLGVVSGCASTDPDVEFGDGDVRSLVLDEARAGGASLEQLTELEGVLAAGGVVGQDTLSGAITRTFACFDDAGIQHTPLTWVDDSSGFPQPDYAFAEIPGLGTDESLALADACLYAHSQYLHIQYSTQPAANELQEAHFEQQKPLLLECLADNGRPLDANANQDEIRTNVALVLLGEEGYRQVTEAAGESRGITSLEYDPESGEALNETGAGAGPEPVGPDCWEWAERNREGGQQ